MENQKWELCPLCGSYMIFDVLKVDDGLGLSFTIEHTKILGCVYIAVII